MTYTGITYKDPEYRILEPIVDDDMCSVMMRMRLEKEFSADGSAKEAKKAFQDLRGIFTEEQMKIEASRCLGCGAAVVDESLCVGCGSFEKTILSGKDFLIREIHIPED